MATITGGTAKKETLTGTGDDDILIGGEGTNWLYGKGGADVFKLSERQASGEVSNDFIMDFEIGVDKIDIAAFGISSFEQLQLFVSSEPLSDPDILNVIYRGTTHSITFINVHFKNLKAADFTFSALGSPVQNGTAYDDVLFAGQGGNILNGGGGEDHLFGGAGNDTLNGGSGQNYLFGGKGRDTLYGGNQDDELFGGDGNDILIGGYTVSTSGNRLYGQGGADTFKVSERIAKNQHNIIVDFEVGIDKIDVSAFGISGFEQLKFLLEDNGSQTSFEADFAGYWNEVRIFNVNANDLAARDFIFSKNGAVTDAGTKNSETLFGSSSNDTLGGAAGQDRIFGGAGNDVLIFGEGDNLYGGTGADIFRVRSETLQEFYSETYISDFQIGVDKLDLSSSGIASFDQVKLIFENDGNLETRLFEYRLILRDVDSAALTARDFIFDKTLARNEVGTKGNDYMFGSALADTLKGGAGTDSLYGGAGNDILSGGEGNDTFYGQAGADLFKLDQKSSGDDIIGDFEVGADRIDLSLSPVTSFDQLRLILTKDYGRTETHMNITSVNYVQNLHLTTVDLSKLKAENFIFSKQDLAVQTALVENGQLFGGTGDNKLIGSAGSDAIFGGSGNDIIIGGEGRNLSYGQAGADIFKLSDRIAGHDSNDVIADFQLGKDKLDVSGLGITSFDQLKLVSYTTGANTSLYTSYNQGYHYVRLDNIALSTLKSGDFIFATKPTLLQGSASYDTLFGGSSADKLSGGDSDDDLFGSDGADQLYGDAGDDYLYGGNGADRMMGGKGYDSFIYTQLSESSSISTGRDTITDFSGGDGDRIDLSDLDASTKTAGDQAFSFIGTSGFTGQSGELRYEKKASDTYIYADINGDRKADFAIHLDDAVTLSKGDFIL